jgi:hypothetical protein
VQYGRPALVASIAWAAFWVAPACFALPEEALAVRLVSPQNGVTLVAGTMAELVWEPAEPVDRFAHIEEWEAFLSLDSGKTYPIEITPHLDEDIRRVRWQVPFSPTAEAAILLRFGDERREVGVELPVRFSIVAPSPSLSIWESTHQLARRVPAPGEAAVPGHPGVVVWVEGSRRGEGARQVVAIEMPGGMRSGFDPPSAHHEIAEAASVSRSSGPLERMRSKAAGSALPVRRATMARAGTALSPPSDILLLVQRQNE